MTSAVQCLSRIEWYLPGHFILLHLIITWAISGQGTRATWNEFNTLESMGFIDLGQWTYPKDAQNDDGRCGHVFLTLRFYIDRIATSETAYDCYDCSVLFKRA